MDDIDYVRLSLTPAPPKAVVTDEMAFEAARRNAESGIPACATLKVAETVHALHSTDGVFTALAFDLRFDATIRFLPKFGDVVEVHELVPEPGGGPADVMQRVTKLDCTGGLVHAISMWGLETPDLVRHLRAQALEWAGTLLNLRLEAYRGDPEQAFLGIAERVRMELEGLHVATLNSGLAVSKAIVATPRFRLEPEPALNESLTFDVEWNGPMDWSSIATFPVGDRTLANAARDILVERHFDPDPYVSHDWRDAAVYSALGRIDRHEGLCRAAGEENHLVECINMLTEALYKRRLIDVDAYTSIKAMEHREADPSDYLEAAAILRREVYGRYGEYRDFLSSAGWKFPFDPLDVATVRANALCGNDLALTLPDRPEGPVGPSSGM